MVLVSSSALRTASIAASTPDSSGDTVASETEDKSKMKNKKVVVVGGGWAGFGAAKALTEAGPYDVTLLDANPNPGGLSAGWRTASGRSVEAGETLG